MAILSTKEYTANTEFDAYGRGIRTKTAFGSYDKTASLPADADYLILARKMVLNNVINSIKLTTPAIADFTDADIVLLDENGAEILDSAGTPVAVLLAETITFINALTSSNVLGFGITGFDRTKSLAELTGRSTGDNARWADIALKVNTGGANTGTFEFEVEYSAPQ